MATQYTDQEIREFKKITLKIAGDYLGISPNAVALGMRNSLLPIGFAVKTEEKYSDNWSYQIVAERLIAYKYGKITEVQIHGVERNFEMIIQQFEEMKRDLLFILGESAETEI